MEARSGPFTAKAGHGVAAEFATPPTLDGQVRLDEAARAAAADDFGHLVHRRPDAVVVPGSAEDVARTIRWAGRVGVRVAPQGRRHSVWGRSQVDAGAVIDMSTLRLVGVRRDQVTVDAGTTWRDVLAATLPHGLTPPVLTDYLDLSVGGTVAVGGVGGTTSTFGVQADTVSELDVVTGTGDMVTCSASRNADLFDAVRAGLGQVGVITRATIRLVPAPRLVRRFLLSYPDLPTMLHDARTLAGDHRFDAVQGAIVPTEGGRWSYRLDVAAFVNGAAPGDGELLAGLADDPARRQPTTVPYTEYVSRLAALESVLRAKGQWGYPHPWLMMFVGDSCVESVVGAELARLHPAVDLGELGQVAVSPIRRAAVSSPLFRLPSDELSYTFNLVRLPTTDNADAANRLPAQNRATYDRVRDAGGTLYPVSALPMAGDDWRRHFASAYERLAEAKRAYDPNSVLTPGYEVAWR